MTELWLKFKDEKGEDQRVLVDGEKFTIGRHSSNDLSIPNGKLSREHVKIDRFAGVFVVSECGSSNGTTINDKELKDPVAFKNGDKLNLGGGIEIQIEMISDDPNATPPGGEAGDEGLDEGGEEAAAAAAPGTASGGSSTPSAGGSGIPTSIFYIAPILGVMILVLLGGIVYFASSGDKPKPDNDNDFVYSTNRDNDRPPKNHDDPGNTTKPNKTSDDPTAPNNGPSTNADPVSSPATVNLSDSAKCEQNGAAFLRRIAQNEPKAFLTGEQAQIINGKIKQIGSSSAIVDNINSARRSAAQIKTLAASKNLKPQLLATAALAKLGTSKGDVLQTAQEMADTLDKLSTQIGSELANDSLLMIAAYDQGAGGDFMKMRNMLQNIATKSTESSREIRTIWFLHKNGKITDSEYNFAVQFLAIGAITQNPKDFGVNTEALVL
jgi:hypothetical protein